MIKAIFFDLYGTLVRFHPPREEVQTRACEHFGFTVTREGLVWGYALADEWMAKANASRKLVPQMAREERQRFFAEYERLVLRGAGVDVDLETAGRVWDMVQDIPYDLTVFDDVFPVVDMLKLRGLTLGILTNVGWNIDKMCQELGLAPYLDFIVTSQDVGRGKPHPPIFLAALERAGVESTDTLMVGDSYISDVQGALGVGIQPLLLDREGVLPEINDCPKIGDLMEILEHI